MSDRMPIIFETIRPICPSCGSVTVGSSEACISCGRKLPQALIIPYDKLWDFDDETVEQLRQYDSLRLMGKFSGKSPDKLRLWSHVKYLYLSRYPIVDALFEKFHSLKILEIDYSKVSSLSSIASCENLESLSMIECKIGGDFDPLLACRKLRVLDLSLSKIKSMSGLNQLDQLIYFRMEGSGVDSLSFLSGMHNLKTLIMNTKVLDRSLGPIRNLDLDRLILKRGCFSKVEVGQFRESCPGCSVSIV